MAEYKDNKQYTELPWDDIGALDKEPVIEIHPHTLIEVELTPTEAAVFDRTIGHYNMGEYGEFYKGREWFLDNNPEAFESLVD
jgi:hypothetical protein